MFFKPGGLSTPSADSRQIERRIPGRDYGETKQRVWARLGKQWRGGRKRKGCGEFSGAGAETAEMRNDPILNK